MAVKKVKTALTKARKIKENIKREVKKLDDMTGGMISTNPMSQAIVPYVRMADKVVDYFDEMLPSLGDSAHPQIQGGSVAGVSQTLSIGRTKPRFTSSQGSIRIQHKELVGEVVMGAPVTLNPTAGDGTSAYTLTPTNRILFPWLATIGSNYDYFRFNRVRLVYVPMCSTATAGRVMLGFDPDGADPLSGSRSELSSYYCSADSSAWGVTKLDCKLPTNQPWYQTNRIINTASYSTSSMGQAFWATWGGTGPTTVGELYVLYDVTLKDPQPSVNDSWRVGGTAGVITNQDGSLTPSVITPAATSLAVTFIGTGVYTISLFAKTTVATAGVTLTPAGPISVVNAGTGANYRSGDGTDYVMRFQVSVSGGGYSISPGIVQGGGTITIGALAGLGAWVIVVDAVDKTFAYPNFT